ncbi:DNA mismatch repair endonuclease MutH [Paraferrimonas sp. SM1919]|uniref:DNA mismatch repair endonuclease MutH n=1 Tax=Paraferrimonas sp. SM1919 TaxID=2662263 RepID=UPI0013D74BF4|nr:DNA mismatch repair endonuclease MutH [Paraferrimonas sp. SM1919]
MINKVKAPQNIEELAERCHQISGLTLGELAHRMNILAPKDLKKSKGWVGQLLELALGANAGTKAEPDFVQLGIELKTLPINHMLQPLETTYVTTVPMQKHTGLQFEQSNLFKKLNHILWVPIQADRNIDLANRTIGRGFLWQPNSEQLRLIKQDFEDLMEMISLGKINEVNAAFGEVLQIRPKAANNKALTDVVGPDGTIIQALPRGFYLRTQFTADILKQSFG